MNRLKRIEMVTSELRTAIDRVTYEYDIRVGELIGILECLKFRLWMDSEEAPDEDNAEESWK